MSGYDGWSSNSTYTIDSKLFYQCNIFKVFGAHTFGKSDLVQKTFSNVPNHDQVEIEFSLLKMDSWDNEAFYFKVDNVIYYEKNFGYEGDDWCGDSPSYFGNNFYNEKFYPVSITITHSSSNLTLTFQSALDQPAYDESYGIKDLKVYLTKNCDPTCFTCEKTTPSICTNCPFFAALSPTSNLCECMDRFHMETSPYTRCEECHFTCKTCDGLASSNCLSCFEGDTLLNGICVPALSLYHKTI